MARIHLSTCDISEDFLSEIRTMTADRPWSLDAAGRSAVVQTFFDNVCAQADVAAPTVEFYRSRHYNRGMQGFTYTPAITGSLGLSVTPPAVKFPRWRTVEIVTAIRKHLDFLRGDRLSDPIAWGASAVYLATPVAFRSAARSGKVRGVEAKDTYTTASWQMIVEADLVDRRGKLRFSSSDIAYFLANGQLPPAIPIEVVTAAETADAGGLLSEGDEELALIEQAEQGALLDAAMAAVEAQEGAVYQEATEGPFNGTLIAPNEITDGLDALGIVALRKVSRGVVSGGYSMTKPVLIHTVRQSLSNEEIAAKIASL